MFLNHFKYQTKSFNLYVLIFLTFIIPSVIIMIYQGGINEHE